MTIYLVAMCIRHILPRLSNGNSISPRRGIDPFPTEIIFAWEPGTYEYYPNR